MSDEGEAWSDIGGAVSTLIRTVIVAMLLVVLLYLLALARGLSRFWV